MADVFLVHRLESSYPSRESFYSPSINYPEYQFSHISGDKNDVYDMIREVFVGLNLDPASYGTENWNPLGEIIKPGMKVVLKPNWVMHTNTVGSMASLVTHPSIIRSVLDYVVLALKGTGSICVMDSPMPSCEFSQLMDNGYNEIWDFYNNNGVKIEVLDGRPYSIYYGAGVREFRSTGASQEDFITVDLGSISKHANFDEHGLRYSAGITDNRKTTESHSEGRHEYHISRKVLEADVIINLPKPKTHMKSGLTGALKNFIGICGEKATLPHYIVANKDGRSDEYLGPRMVFLTESRLRNLENSLFYDGKNISSHFIRFMRLPFYLYRKATRKINFGTGNWHGNDTIWRTTHDINRIAKYCDANGIIQDRPQRTFIHIGDMIISGEANGPLMPNDKQVGIILGSFDAVLFDECVAWIMGFEKERIPTLNNLEHEKFPLRKKWSSDALVIISDSNGSEELKLGLLSKKLYSFIPASGWQGQIEKRQ